MSAVYVTNLVINSGVDFDQTFTLENSQSNSLLDLTGYTASAQMRKHSGSSTYVDFNVSIPSPEFGKIVISLGNTTTTSLKPGRYMYDVLVTEDSSGIKSKVIEGMVLVREGVTR